jgi:hypothetical protein
MVLKLLEDVFPFLRKPSNTFFLGKITLFKLSRPKSISEIRQGSKRVFILSLKAIFDCLIYAESTVSSRADC